MIFQLIKNLIASRDLRAQCKMFGIMKLEGGLIFYHAAIETGLLKKLMEPSTLDEIALDLNITNRQLLSSLLELGCSLKEVSYKKGRYCLMGRMAGALVNNKPFSELIRETVLYHTDVARRLGTYLLKNEKGDYLKDFGGVIAESSRMMEPMIRAFIYHMVKKSKPLSILEIGCGSGEYLKYYVDINRHNSGIAIDKDESAVRIAREKIKENGIEGNFTVMQDDIMNPAAIKNKSFDLVTSFSNIYYFTGGEKKKLFSDVRAMLKENGRFMLGSAFKSGGLSTCYYDLIFSATHGLYPIPRSQDIVRQLYESGFSRVKSIRIMGESFKGIVAYK